AARHHAPDAAARPHRGQARAGPAGDRASPRAGRRLERQRRKARRPRQAGVCPAALVQMNGLERMARAPIAALEFANIVLTERDAQIAVTPKDVVWTHRTTTLYRYRSSKRA